MGVELSSQEQIFLEDLQPLKTLEEFQLTLGRLQEPLATYVLEVMEPDQRFATMILEIKDLYLLLCKHEDVLAAKGYPVEERLLLRDAYVAMLMAQDIFTQRLRVGDFKTRPVTEVVAASKPWRELLRKKADFAFAREPVRRAAYQDHNTTGTIEEEVSDLRALNLAVANDKDALKRVGFTDDHIAEGLRLEAAAEGRDLLAVLGIRNQTDVKLLRDRLVTLTIELGRYGRKAGLSAFAEDLAISAQFERPRFGNALRRIKRRKNLRIEGDETDDGAAGSEDEEREGGST